MVKSCEAQLPGSLWSIASDGESQQGAALAKLTLTQKLSHDSPIYPLLSPLPFLNLLVGRHDVTCDKDYKHLFKWLRSLLLHMGGFQVFETIITSPILELHLHENGMPSITLNGLLNPADKQDVPKALELLKAVWELPCTDGCSNKPGWAAQCQALYIFGQVCYMLVCPFIDVTLSLRQQLEHLSAVSHLLLILFRANPRKGHFMPTQLYSDIQVMIKNVYFCVAKAKVDPNITHFYAILLGTDRLEVTFSILRTIVGNDANADTLQLTTQLSHISEVQNILALHPEWDHTPCHLKLPSLNELEKKSQHMDHITPTLWEGDVRVGGIILLTAWQDGAMHACLVDTEVRSLYDTLPKDRLVDILLPLGELVIKMNSAADDSHMDELEMEDGDDVRDATAICQPSVNTAGTDAGGPITSEATTPEGLDTNGPVTNIDPDYGLDLEDVINSVEDSDAPLKVSPYLMIATKSGEIKKVHKAQALKVLFEDIVGGKGSLDQQKRIQGLTRFSVPNPKASMDANTNESIFGNSICIGDPAVTLLSVDWLVFLAIIQVSSL